jgi:CheY-like chemotaxis protein
MRVLYVEDNPANVFLVKRVARMGNHEIINLIDGQQALRKFDDIQPDLVLMDIQLSGEIGGLDVVRELRERGVSTPIIAVTAYAMVGDKERCLEAGCDEYMAKPLPVPRLVELFETHSKRAAAATSGTDNTTETDETADNTATPGKKEPDVPAKTVEIPDVSDELDTDETDEPDETATKTATEAPAEKPVAQHDETATETAAKDHAEKPVAQHVATDSIPEEPGSSVTPPADATETARTETNHTQTIETDSAQTDKTAPATDSDADAENTTITESAEQPDVEGR